MIIQKRIIKPEKVRSINGGFSFIPHRFLRDGFLVSLTQKEILLYFFLILASDRNGLSFYSYDCLCSMIQMNCDDYLEAREGLIQKDLIAFDGTFFQVLELPEKPVQSEALAPSTEILKIIKDSLNGDS